LLGIPAETYMLPIEGKLLLEQVFPRLYEGEDGFKDPFSFSRKWMQGFFTRFHLSNRRITTKKTILKDKGIVIDTIRRFHEQCKAKLCREYCLKNTKKCAAHGKKTATSN
jgi:hypothetical protein